MIMTRSTPSLMLLFSACALCVGISSCSDSIGQDEPVTFSTDNAVVDRVIIHLHTDSAVQASADGQPITAIPVDDVVWGTALSDADLYRASTDGIDQSTELSLADEDNNTALASLRLRIGTTADASVDETLPTIALTSDSAQVTTNSLVTITFTASEAVTGLSSSDLTITGGTIDSWTAVSASVYTCRIRAQSSAGTLTVTVPAQVCTDVARNFFMQAATFSLPITTP